MHRRVGGSLHPFCITHARRRGYAVAELPLTAETRGVAAPACFAACPYFSCHHWSRASTRGMISKLCSGGGSVVVHSSVRASQGSGRAISPLRQLRTRTAKYNTRPAPRISEPTVAMKFGVLQPMFASYVNVRRGKPFKPRKCIGKNVTLKPTKMTRTRPSPQSLWNQPSADERNQ